MTSTRQDPITTGQPAPGERKSLEHSARHCRGTSPGLWGAIGCLLLAATLALSSWGTPSVFAALDPTDTATGTGALAHESGGNANTADGNSALAANTTGSRNTASGVDALYSNITGGSNTVDGDHALYSNTGGSANTANGVEALYSNTTGVSNTADGAKALYDTTTSNSNTASGGSALFHTTTGSGNTASGASALYSNTSGELNTATGDFALYSNNTGSNNTASGPIALYSNTTGRDNTGLGARAGDTDGSFANTTGSNNTFLGALTGPATNSELTNATAIGWNARVGESNALVLGGTGSDAVKVGIGTTTPGSALTVAGTIESTSGGIKFPDGSTQTTASLQVGANFKIPGNGALGGTLTVAGNAGVGTASPNSLLQVGSPGTKYGAYLQLPLVTNEHAPPARQCNSTTFVGRIVMQYNSKTNAATLRLCSSAGKWVVVH
jgi:hypothetical protein